MIPGKQVDSGLYFGKFDPAKYLRDLGKKKFNGYVSAAIYGKTGVEEGTVIFKNGEIILSNYEYLKHAKKFSGKKALRRFLNCLRAEHGVLDCAELEPLQVDLIAALADETIGARDPQIPLYFSFAYEDQLCETKKEEGGLKKLLRDFEVCRADLVAAAKAEGRANVG